MAAQYIEDQRTINEMIEDIRKLQTKVYYFSSINACPDMDKIDSMLLELLGKHECKYSKI